MPIQKVAVIGAGVMGAGIAAHIANAGVSVVLLDIVPDGANDRSALARGAVAKMLKSQPASFMHSRNAKRISTGNLEDDLEALADCDWIIEAVVERLDIKQALYKTIDAHRKAGAVVSSNTSTIPLSLLTEGMSAGMAGDFLIAHFFNPPRYMRLLELVGGPQTRGDALEMVRAFCDSALGKGVVTCHDRPGFIANRIGTYWIQTALASAMELGLTVEAADAIAGAPMGVPSTGVFGLVDLVGIDLMPHILGSLKSTLPSDDPLSQGADLPPLVETMIADGYTGRKGKGGFYRMDRKSGRRVKQAIDLITGEYRDAHKPKLACIRAARDGGLRALVEHKSDGGRFAWEVARSTLSYTTALVPEIARSPADVDAAMRLGYSWRKGPFELIDELGVDWFIEQLEAEGTTVPPLLELARGRTFYRVADGAVECLSATGTYEPITRPEGTLLLADVKRQGPRVDGNGSASLWDLGDGVLCLEFHSKMNAIDVGVLTMVGRSLKAVSRGHRALVIHNDADNFSVGANIGLLLFAANMAAYEQIDAMIKGGQDAYRALKYAPFPVVGAPSGMALGGGCEILLHCDAVQAHAETYMGLVEVGVGLVPGWGGCKELLTRWSMNKRRPGGPMPAVAKAFELISTASVGKSAEEARDMLYLRPEDGVSMNRDRLLADAKARALELTENYSPPEPTVLRLPGPTARCAMNMAVQGFHKMGKATAHDTVVGDALAGVLSGGDTDMLDEISEDDLYRLEREAFVGLARSRASLARVEHMLETGKPLRN
jgi:3-hydroxyacyl-CoA dehydrogenase